MPRYDMSLSARDANRPELRDAHQEAVDWLRDGGRRRSNAVGVAIGRKWKDGRPTRNKDATVLILVTHKVDDEQALGQDVAPKTLSPRNVPTDVYPIGFPFAGQDIRMQPHYSPAAFPQPHYSPGAIPQPPYPGVAPAVVARGRVRPAPGGYSVGPASGPTGTIATSVYDTLPTATGIPQHFYLLSNNHVLANSNAAAPGAPIVQPGRADGGTDPLDRIATLSRYIPLTFQPDVPLEDQDNLVDAAIAEADFNDIDRQVHWIGRVRAWRPKDQVDVGTEVQKTGRTTRYTTGQITAVNATVDVAFDRGRVARLKDQIIMTKMSDPGDSGSLILTMDGVAVGLLFAGSDKVTIANQIENVCSLLGVEVAEQTG
jgi:hypothetical protein